MEKRFHEITQANKCLLRFSIIVRNYILATYRARSTKNVLDSEIQRPSRVRQNRCLFHRLSQSLWDSRNKRIARELETNESGMMGTPRFP